MFKIAFKLLEYAKTSFRVNLLKKSSDYYYYIVANLYCSAFIARKNCCHRTIFDSLLLMLLRAADHAAV